jgi:uncharacterized damage-inducible protein DinB
MPGQVPPLDDERELLLAYLAQQRDGLRYAAFGLTDDQARLTPTKGSLSIGGILKHCCEGEAGWIGLVAGRERASAEDGQARYEDHFRFGPDDTLDALLFRYEQVAKETEAVIGGLALDHPVPVPQDEPWFPKDVESWSVRWVLLHLIEEIARHAGHADIIRETIDGATMHPLMAAAEGWPATDWLKPWEPA